MNAIQVAYRAFCKERFPLPTEQEVAGVEKRLGIPLPPDYRSFLLQYNGGIFNEPSIMPPNDECPLDCVTELAGINATHPFAELAAPGGFTPAIFDDNDPPQILPIGYTTMGNLLFLVTDPKGDDYGWLGLKLASSVKSFLLAKQMDEFFGRLRRPT